MQLQNCQRILTGNCFARQADKISEREIKVWKKKGFWHQRNVDDFPSLEKEKKYGRKKEVWRHWVQRSTNGRVQVTLDK